MSWSEQTECRMTKVLMRTILPKWLSQERNLSGSTGEPEYYELNHLTLLNYNVCLRKQFITHSLHVNPILYLQANLTR